MSETPSQSPDQPPRLSEEIEAMFAQNEFEETVSQDYAAVPRNYIAGQFEPRPVPATIGKYEVQKLLGSGAYGSVYLGFDRSLERRVAIKVPNVNADKDMKARFLDEARHLARATHPAIVNIFDVGIEEDYCYIVSDYLEGSDLNHWLKTSRPSWKESARVVACVADALAAAHAKRIVHRDVKPSNIIMQDRPEGVLPVLVDFGLALSDQSAEAPKRHMVAGTPNFMAPEQVRGQSDLIDGRTDIFALGVILYRMISGVLPFRAESVNQLYHKILNEEPRPPRQSSHELPRELERICLKALSKGIADRYATAGDMAADLRTLLKQHESASSLTSVSTPPVAAGKQSMRILVADDHELTRFKLKNDLEKWGHNVVVASNGEEAWSLYQNSEFSIVITDWMMPKVDGLELVRRIRESEHSNYVYLIMLTVKSEMQDIVAGMGAGADDFLTKPVHRDELQVRVRAGARITNLNRELNESNRKLRQSLSAAAQIQQSYLPDGTPEVSGFGFSWDHKASNGLGGDMLNIVKLDESHVGIYVLDVNGEGVPAALMATNLSRLLSPPTNPASVLVDRSDSTGRILRPAEVAERLNQQVATQLGSNTYFTLVYGVLDCRTKKFQFTSAAHPPVIYQRHHESPSMIDIAGFPVGLTAEAVEFEERTIVLQSGDRVMMYSDGLPDAMDRQGEVFGAARILEIVTQLKQRPLAELTQSVMSKVAEWRNGAEIRDDISVLYFEVE